MKTVGIVGGIGPESTIDYYRSIIAEYRRRQPDRSSPSILIDSIGVWELLDLVGAGEYDALVRYLAPEIARLVRAGADFVVFASNTPHIVFDELQRNAGVPMLSIVEAAAGAVRDAGMRKVALFGTKFTMAGAFYPEVFTRHGVEVVRPSAEEQASIHSVYMDELLSNIFRPESRERMLGIVDRLRDAEHIEGVVLGGTELPLLLRQDEHGDVRFFDTTRIHVDRIVTELLR